MSVSELQKMLVALAAVPFLAAELYIAYIRQGDIWAATAATPYLLGATILLLAFWAVLELELYLIGGVRS